MRRRHYLGPIPGYNPGNPQMQTLRREVIGYGDEFSSTFGKVSPSPYSTVMEHTRQGIRGRYMKAWQNINNNRINITPATARLSAFVKYEKIPVGKLIDRKPPRLIQFRSYEYLYLLKSAVLGYSLKLKSDGDRFLLNGQKSSTIFTKLHNMYGTASVLRENWEMFSDPIAICLDQSKFDGHYCEELLGTERAFWKSVCKRSRFLNALFKAQINNKGFTQNGVRFKTKGGRMSGEYTTSDGNSITNYGMLVRWLKASGLKEDEFRISVNGDDSVVFIDRKNQHKLLPLDFFRNFNMETECDRIVDNFQEISFCQSSPIRVNHEGKQVWYMVKEPWRAMARLCFAPSQYEHCVDRYLSGIGLCELASYSGVPVMQSFAIRILQISSTSPLASVNRIPASLSGNVVAIKQIADDTRYDFELAFGIPVIQQMDMERQIVGDTNIHPSILNYIQRYRNFVNLKPRFEEQQHQ